MLEQGEAGKSAKALIDDLPLFSAARPPAPAPKPSPALEQLAQINPDDLSPKEALNALYALKALLNP
jgi:DNA mismatch repair protein MutS